jgi:signal transduction histidine kinase
MSVTASALRRYWPELAWAVFALGNVAFMVRAGRWETIPFHFVWVSLTILYGFRVWSLFTTAVVLEVVMIVTGTTILRTVVQYDENVDEIAEVPLMAAMFLAMVWHARRRQAAMDEVRQLADAEHRLMEREREFIHNASHELRTPITIARGHAELIRRAHRDDATTSDVEVVIDELARLSLISERLLTLAASEQPEFVQPAPVEVRSLLDGVAKRWSFAARRQFLVECLTDGRFVADATRLETALDALIENAVKYTRDDDAITLGAHTVNGTVVLSVADTGTGIPAEQLDVVFDRFARVDASRARDEGGTGLGLAIVKAIAEAHGGKASVHSEVGVGTTVEMHLPGVLSREVLVPMLQ